MTGFDSKREAAADKMLEPVAWMCSAFDGEPCEQTNHDECGNPIPLYTTPPQPAQEPVAHVYLFDHDGRPLIAWDNAKGIKIGDKLYTPPLQPAQEKNT